MRLKEARERAGLTGQAAAIALKQAEPRICRSDISRYENGVCLPTPAQFRRLKSLYGVRAEDLATPEEVDFGIHRPRKAEKSEEAQQYYKLTVRLPMECARGLTEELLVLGHESVTAWIKKCRKNLHRAYIKKKAALDAATSKTATGGISEEPIHTSSIHKKEELSSGKGL